MPPFNAFAIPSELRALNQWCLWKYEDIGTVKPTKIPYQPNGNKTSVTDKSTWNSFNDCFNAYNFGGYDGLGFIFSDSDPYAFVDLDSVKYLKDGVTPNPNYQFDLDRQLRIFHEFNSYSEVSPSGEGLHIIIKGSLPSGKRRDFVELYSSARYATMTGNVYADKPIADRNDLLLQLYHQMGDDIKIVAAASQPQYLSDDQVITHALGAVNGEKFLKLHTGRWQELYSSQSEADYAYIDIIAFYSKNKEQIVRLFRASPLGQRDKAKRKDYVLGMVNQSFDKMLPDIDFNGFKNALEVKLANKKEIVKIHDVNNQSSIPLPPGLIGEIAQFIFEAAPRPVEEIALAGAIALMSGICGRSYNISSTGLNQYVLMVGGTGVGKEAAAAGISKLINAVKMQVPTASEFIGPSEISSGPALFKYLGTQSRSFVSILGEFGLRIKQLSAENANGADISLRRMLLDLFNKSGFNDVAYKSIYSDKDKNTTDIFSPALSIFGESTPERLYTALNEEMISEGLLPRFHIIEYRGNRRDLNEHHASIQPPFQLVEKLGAICAHSMTMNYSMPRKVVNVETNPAAYKILQDFDKMATDKINSGEKNVIKELWNRAHVKALKLSALIAVGVNYVAPVVTEDHVNWSITLITNDINNLTARFEAGEIGQAQAAESKQVTEVKKTIREYIHSEWEIAKKYSDSQALHIARIVPYAYISRRLIASAVFRHDRMGATNAIKRTLSIMMDSGQILEVGRAELGTKYGTTQRAFVIKDVSIIE